ncbi:RNA polymerase factor sigma-54 [Salinithrix halophila]|uniref:RNA polymerase factor sigma-54 n=1 Tax=Salinithrix halophila TaxID=1485204 RepID=A0ABV8JHW9_9BACL
MALSMGYGLAQEQRMKLVMTPELRQAIQVLQYPAADLIQYIQEQVMENPVLEMEEPPPSKEDEPFHVSEEKLSDWAAFLRRGEGGRRTGINWDKEDRSLERVTASEETLTDVLEGQIRLLSLDSKQHRICRYIIGNLDEDGYVEVPSKQICKRFNIDEEELEGCFRIIHSLDPVGVGARSLSECLRIQLLREEELDPIALDVVGHCLTDLAEGRYRKAARRLGCSVSDVQRAADRIRQLNPRPGLAYNFDSPRYVQPDVSVVERNGMLEVVVNEGYIPRLGISTHYERMLDREDEGAKQAASYIKSRLQSAMWLLKSIEQRRHTLHRVTGAILEEQREFFEHGISRLKPLTLRQVAEALELHESTVSRATQHKYMQTPRGLFPFRFFFQSGVATETGGNTSAQSVKDKIARLIAEENKSKPLSDQKIAGILEEEGVRISRRTVAKYREEMGLGSSQMRRRYEEEV